MISCVTLVLFYQVEAELAELTVEERIEYLKSLGVNESGLGNLIRVTYDLLGLRTYFTTGEKVTTLVSSNTKKKKKYTF